MLGERVGLYGEREVGKSAFNQDLQGRPPRSTDTLQTSASVNVHANKSNGLDFPKEISHLVKRSCTIRYNSELYRFLL
jgi:hypothetical protein